jgi:putative endonuclease
MRSSPRRPPDTRRRGAAIERRAAWHYRLRGYRILATNVWAGGNELDLIVRRGSRLVFCEVKGKSGPAFGDPLEMVTPEKQRRLVRAAEAWLADRPELARLEASFEVVAVRGRRLERLSAAF